MDESPESLPATDLLLAHAEFLSALSARLVSSGVDPDDLQQETWLSALRHPPADAGAVRAWLAKVVRNHALQSYRSRRRRAAREQWAAREEGLPSTDEIVARENARRSVVASLSGLSEPYRSTLLLRFYEDLPPRDVAARMGVPVETVRTRVKRGLALLREDLDRRSGGDRSAWTSALAPLALGREALGPSGASPALLAPLGVLALFIAALLWVTRTEREPRDRELAKPRVEQLAAEAPTPGAGAPRRSEIATGAPRRSYELRLVFADDGAPAVGLSAQVEHDGDPAEAHAWVSDEQGRAPHGVQLAPGDRVRVAPSLHSRSLEHAFDELALESGALVLHVQRASSVRGRVIDDRSRPVAGARVWATAPNAARLEQGEPQAVLAQCSSDSSGEFVLLELPASFYLHASDGERTLARGAQVQRREHSALEELELRLEQGWSVRGRVVDSTGAPLPGVRIATGTHDLRGPGRAAAQADVSWRNLLRGEWTSDADGRFLIRGLAPIAHNLALSLEGYGVAERRVTAPDWDETIVLVRGVELAFELRDLRGSALDGHVHVLGASGERVEGATREGRAALSVDPAESRVFVRARASGYATRWLTLELDGRARVAQSIELRAERGLELAVVDPRGEPIAGARALVRGAPLRLERGSIAVELWDELLEIGSAQTGADGRARLGGLGPDAAQLEVSAPGFVAQDQLAVGSAADLTLVLEPAASERPELRLEARDALSGAPLTQCVVTARLSTPGGAHALDVRFDARTLLELPQGGLWSLYAHAAGHAPSIRRWRTGDDTNIEFELAPERSLSVRVRDLRGAPVHPARLIVSDEQGGPIASAVSSTYWANYLELPESGALVVRGLPAARVELGVRSGQFEGLEPLLVDLREEREAEVVFELPADLSSPRVRAEFEFPEHLASHPAAQTGRARGRRAAATRLTLWDSSGVLCGRYRLELDESGAPRFVHPWTMMSLRFDAEGVLEDASQQRLERDALFTDFGPRSAGDGRRFTLLAPAGGGKAELEVAGVRVASARFAPPFDATIRFAPLVR